MKKISSILLLVMIFLTIINSSFANDELSNNIELEGSTYKKINSGIEVDNKISNVKLDNSNDILKGNFFINDQKVKIDAKFINKDEHDLNHYIGTANYKSKIYNVDIIENNEGLSGLIYDDGRKDITPFVITKNSSSKKIQNKSKDIINKVNSEMVKLENVSEPLGVQIGTRAVGVSRSKYIYHSGWSFPYVISAGTASGTLYYKTNIPTGKFWVDKVVGTIAWESGFDGLAVINDNEIYGHLWGSPKTPQKRQYTWNIDKIAEKPGSYYYRATVSYTLIVKNVPLLFWDNKKSYISY